MLYLRIGHDTAFKKQNTEKLKKKKGKQMIKHLKDTKNKTSK